jgi:NADH-quinone oxidoreductase subunit G
LEKAPAVLLIGFEPEEESPIVFLRLRKSTRLGRTKVYAVAPLASRGLNKLDGTLLPAVPRGEASALGSLDSSIVEALSADGAVLLAGERLASAPGALSAVAALAERTGARLAWVPRRAGERGALDAGALPTLLAGGRPVADDAARAEVERIWNASVPSTPGRDVDAIVSGAADGSLAALLVGGVDPDDLADPLLARAALDNAGFVVSLEIRASAVTEHADVVLPVAPAAEKAGRYVNWEGRRRPFDLTVIADVATGSGSLADGRVLHALADELDVDLGLASVQAARDELLRLAPGTARTDAPRVAAGKQARVRKGEALLATWPELLDAGRAQDGDEYLAATAKPARAVLSTATAVAVGVRAGGRVAVTTDRGSIVVPVEIGDVVDGVVWLPTNARGCAVRATLGAVSGDVVRLGNATAPPVIGADPADASGGGS